MLHMAGQSSSIHVFRHATIQAFGRTPKSLADEVAPRDSTCDISCDCYADVRLTKAAS